MPDARTGQATRRPGNERLQEKNNCEKYARGQNETEYWLANVAGYLKQFTRNIKRR